jgi:hypothetical protein
MGAKPSSTASWSSGIEPLAIGSSGCIRVTL